MKTPYESKSHFETGSLNKTQDPEQDRSDIARNTFEIGETNLNSNKRVKEVAEQEKKSIPLKAQIKRYSTKKIFKHHVEEVKVDFYSDSDDNENSYGDTTSVSIQL